MLRDLPAHRCAQQSCWGWTGASTTGPTCRAANTVQRFAHRGTHLRGTAINETETLLRCDRRRSCTAAGSSLMRDRGLRHACGAAAHVEPRAAIVPRTPARYNRRRRRTCGARGFIHRSMQSPPLQKEHDSYTAPYSGRNPQKRARNRRHGRRWDLLECYSRCILLCD